MSWQSVEEMIIEAKEQFRRTRYVCQGSCCRDIQSAAVQEAVELFKRLEAYRLEAFEAQNESQANPALLYQMTIGACVHHLQIWLLLKCDRGDEAYGELIEAQRYVAVIVRFLDDQELKDWYTELLEMETVLFPPQNFLSISGLWDYAICSICGGEYGECGHIAGRSYMGHLCGKDPHHVNSLDHVALVKNPDDKGCHILKYKANAFMHCSTTLRKLEPVADDRGDAHAVIFREW